MTLVTIVQARMGSTRLPGKVLMRVAGKTILEHVLDRIGMCEADTGTVVVATGAHVGDNVIEGLCHRIGVECFRSSEHDVLHRYQQAAIRYGATSVLRVTADCPLLCPTLTAQLLHADPADYVTFENVPLGLTPELITAEALYRCWEHADDPFEREHVTLHALNRPNEFGLVFMEPEDWLFDRRTWRLTVDFRDDIALLERLCVLTGDGVFGLPTREVVGLVAHDRASLELARPR